MLPRYDDITQRIAEAPRWYDANGVPRYAPFQPDLCPDIYARQVVLLHIACQECKRGFLVEMHGSIFTELPIPRTLHYGDPPAHGCIGDTMNCDDLEVLEAWKRPHLAEWTRCPDLEGLIDQDSNPFADNKVNRDGGIA